MIIMRNQMNIGISPAYVAGVFAACVQNKIPYSSALHSTHVCSV